MIRKPQKWLAGQLAKVFAGVLLAAAANVQAIDIYAVTAGGILARFDSATPGTPSLLVLISGLGPGESVVGLDFRPANGKLYALTKDGAGTGSLYSVDRITGFATFVTTLAADPVDLPSPYTALSGT